MFLMDLAWACLGPLHAVRSWAELEPDSHSNAARILTACLGRMQISKRRPIYEIGSLQNVENDLKKTAVSAKIFSIPSMELRC